MSIDDDMPIIKYDSKVLTIYRFIDVYTLYFTCYLVKACSELIVKIFLLDVSGVASRRSTLFSPSSAEVVKQCSL